MARTENVQLPELAESYLTELAFVLRDADERNDVLHEIRSHFEDAVRGLSSTRQNAAIQTSIAQLGTVEQIASTSTPRGSSRERAVSGDETSSHGRFGRVMMLFAAFASVPAAFALPLYGGIFALLVFVWSFRYARAGRGRDWTPVAVSGLGLLIGVIMLFAQFPFGPAEPVIVDLPVTPS